MFRAIREGKATKVKALATCRGTNLMLPSKPGWLATHQAAWFGQDSCLRMLLSGTCTPQHAHPGTPYCHNEQWLLLCLAQPGMVNKRTSRGETPIMVAVSRVQLGCVQVLLEHGADAEIPNNEKETPLYKGNKQTVVYKNHHHQIVNFSQITAVCVTGALRQPCLTN